MRKMIFSSTDDRRTFLFFFAKSDVSRWGNIRYDGAHKHTQPSLLGTQNSTWDLRTCARGSKLNVWCGIMRGSESIITVTWMCVRYLSFLKLMPFNNKKKAKFVSTGRHSSPLQSWVTNCPERQISKSMDWKRVVSRSPDLSSLDIFLAGIHEISRLRRENPRYTSSARTS